MKKEIILFGIVCLLSVSVSVYSQKIIIVKEAPETIVQMKPGVLKDSVLLDSTQLSISYRFRNSNDMEKWSDILMQIGPRVMKQTDICLYCDAYMQTMQVLKGPLAENREMAGCPSNLFMELICNREDKNMQIICGDFFNSNALKYYEQMLPDMNWELCDGARTIAGYECYKATTDYGGRAWTVYYTAELPLPYGPWKLNGLPGMILMAESGDFRFECINIQRSKAPIMQYSYGKIRHITMAEYLSYERNCYKHPYQTFANGEEASIILSDEQGQMIYLDQNWSIPYNPIELE